MINTFVLLNRKILEWEWYDNANVFRLFIHLIIKANHKDKSWRGIQIKRGQLVTSLGHLASELDLSVRQIRTALDHLKSTGEVKLNATNKYTVVTLVKYELYQGYELYDDNQKTNKSQTDDNQMTTTKQYNNETREQDYINIEGARQICLENNVWTEAIKNNYVLSEQQFQDYIKKFTSHATIQGKTVISPAEYKKYFVSWYKKHTGKGFKGRQISRQPKQSL